MKEQELRACAVCAICGKKFGSCGIPMFYRVTIGRYGLEQGALLRQTGMEMFFGGHVALAQVMGANEEMTTVLMKPVTVTVCEACSTKPLMVAEMAQIASDQQGPVDGD